MTLIGDQKKDGICHSYQADFISMMPKNELINIVIKEQFNCLSEKNLYSNKFIPIIHEYLLIWRKSSATLWNICFDTICNAKRIIASSWRNAVRIAFSKSNGKATLSDIYEEIEKIASHLIKNNINWKAKIRQILQKHYANIERGVWAIAK